MKTINIFLIILALSSNIIAQFNQPKQITDFGFDAKNPSFIEYQRNEPDYFSQSEIFFEAHIDSSINIYYMNYSVESDSFFQPIPITEGNSKNKNLKGIMTFDTAPHKLIVWETNVNGDWDIAYSKNYGSGFTQPQILFSSEKDETSPSIVLDHFNYFFEDLNILFVQDDSVLVYTKTDTSDLTITIFPADDSTKYSDPAGITYEGDFYVVAVEKVNSNTPRLVYKTRHFNSSNWSEKSVAFEGDSVQNPKFVDPYYPYSPNIYLNFEIIENGKKRSVLLSPDNFGDNNPPLFYVAGDSSVESSEFDAFSYYIVTEQAGIESFYPYAYKVNNSDSTFIIAGSENYWYEYKIPTSVHSAKVAIGPLSFKEFGIVSYTIWEDSSNGNINLYGLQRYDILSSVVDESYLNHFSLSQNYPNPFNPSTVISYRLPVTSNVTLKVFDILGNEIATLVNEEKPAGEYEVEFNVGQTISLSSGIYFYQLKAAVPESSSEQGFIQTKKMILLK